MASDILIVDDEADIREMVAGILEDDGHRTRLARDSDEALKAVEERRPHLVILDIWLQGSRLDGLEVLNIIKKAHPELPVVIVSGHGTVATAVEATKRGAFDFLVKPASRAMVQQALQRARLFAESERHLARQGQARLTVTAPLDEGVREFGEAAQERLVRSVLEDCGHNVAQAARTLGLSRENLYYFIRKFGIDRSGAGG